MLSPSGFGGSWSSSRSSSEDDEPKFYNGKRNLSFTWGREPYRFRTDYWIKVKGTRLVFRHLQKVSIPMFVLLQLVHKLAEICFRNQVKLWGVDRLITIILSKLLLVIHNFVDFWLKGKTTFLFLNKFGKYFLNGEYRLLFLLIINAAVVDQIYLSRITEVLKYQGTWSVFFSDASDKGVDGIWLPKQVCINPSADFPLWFLP